jgi:hypothetical protein
MADSVWHPPSAFRHLWLSGGGEMVDAGDLKSPPGNRLRVRVPPLAYSSQKHSAGSSSYQRRSRDATEESFSLRWTSLHLIVDHFTGTR